MKILVTGSNGFIGSHLVNELSRDHSVIGFTRCIGNLLGEGIFSRFSGIECVVHCAGLTFGDYVHDYNASEFVRDNVTMTTNVLEESVRIGVKKFIYLSTNEVCGFGRHSEEDVFDPMNFYSASKAASECIVLGFRDELGVVIVRPENVFGCGGSDKKLIPVIVRKLLNGEEIEVYNDYRKRWLFVGDLCNAIGILVRENCRHSIYNVSGGIECTVGGMIEIISNCLGISGRVIRSGSIRPGDNYYSYSERFRDEFGWSDDISAGRIEEVCLWWRDRFMMDNNKFMMDNNKFMMDNNK